MKLKKILFYILLFTIIIGTLGFLEFKGIIWHTKIFAIGYKIEGLDISHYQGKINWEKVKKENNFSFVYIKATEGHDFVDDKFEYNWQETRKNNFNVGAYHFFSMRSKGKVQAEKFIELVPKIDNNLPPVIDIEISNNHNKIEVEKNLFEMSNILKQHYGKEPILYVTYDSYNLYIKNSKLNNELWFRDILKRPNIGNKKWIFWQYSNRGHVKGIKGYVDKNVFYGNKEEFKRIIK